MNKEICSMEKYFEIYEDYIKSLDNEINSAVAIKYDIENDIAPVVTAKGKNILAKKMVELAKKHDIPIINDNGSVVELMKISIGSEIPYFMYEAISIILAHVYKLSREK